MMDVIIYFADASAFSDVGQFSAGYRRLCPMRREKVDALRHPGQRAASLCAGLLLQAALKREDVEASAPVRIGSNGKPFLPSCPALHFNLSHSDAMVMCALAGSPVGCDTERIRPLNSAAERRLSPEEQALLASIPQDADRLSMFFRIWTLKESFLKATGDGLTVPLSSFSVLPSEEGTPPRTEGVPESFRFLELSLRTGYRSALCVNCSASLQTVQTVPADDLLRSYLGDLDD